MIFGKKNRHFHSSLARILFGTFQVLLIFELLSLASGSWDGPVDDGLSNEEANKKNVNYKNDPKMFLWKDAPCQKYDPQVNSKKNRDRVKGCKKIKDRLAGYMKTSPSKNEGCKLEDLVGAECVYMSGATDEYSGRCYLAFKTGNPSVFQNRIVNKCLE